MSNSFFSVYRAYLSKPWLGLALFLVLAAVSFFQARYFYYDASADSLVAQDDPDLAYYRQVTKHFSGENFLFLTYTPNQGGLLTPPVLADISNLVEALKGVEGVAGVASFFDAPLLKSPPVPISQLATGYRTLNSPDVDLKAAHKELTTSPLFKELLISEDGKSTAIRIDLAANKELKALFEERQRLREQVKQNSDFENALKEAEEAYREAYKLDAQATERVLNKVRGIRAVFEDKAVIHLGGVPMIAPDMIGYVKRDIRTFGLASLILMMVTLYAFFRSWRWVVLPVLAPGMTLLITIGLLGLMHKPVTVISANFMSLLMILSVSIGVHLITRYREILWESKKGASHLDIVAKTMKVKLAPCFYTTLTTAAGFASLMASSIIPVVDFGWIMCMGVFVALMVFYLFFPVLVVLLPKEVLKKTTKEEADTPLIKWAYTLSTRKMARVLTGTILICVVTAVGIFSLSLHNRFPDYFKESTDIHQGLAFIDQHLGGTVPMDIIVHFPPYEPEVLDEDDDFFDEEADEEADEYPERYWFTPDKISTVRALETYLNNRPEIGKVLSLATLEELARDFNGGKPLGAVEIVAILGALPQDVRESFVAPYAAPEEGLMRLTARIHETGPVFSRGDLIQGIKDYATEQMGLPEGAVQVTGMNVLFHGMLKELFNSQASTLLAVVAVTFFMFLVLLRSLPLAVAGLVPNVLAAFVILGFMGFAQVPLDMMTLTIAAIVIGIGVDDAIHYLHYFKTKRGKTDLLEALRYSHSHIGRALYITSLTVVVGFSVLSLSSFVPTVHFGILAAVAMVLALLANLVLLPVLLIIFAGRKKII